MKLPKPDSLYIHIPFCSHICPYCDFAKVFYRPDWADAYLETLEEEAKSRHCGLFSTVYIGGGTPTSLNYEQLDRLLCFARSHLKDGGEFSIEANPDALDEKKVSLLARHDVNRVSIGAQSSSKKSLATLGRSHDFEAVLSAITLLRNAGITNINVDWMYGFPGQTMEDLQEDIEAFSSLGVPHLSAYSLILEEGTAYHAHGVEPLSDDLQQDYFDAIIKALTEKGYQRYEVSNFSLPGYRCRHNLTYWKDLPYVGLGLSAAGFLDNIRYKNTKSLDKYLKGEYIGDIEDLDEASLLEDYFLTNLRLLEGFELSEFEQRFGFSFLSHYEEKAADLIKRGLLVIEDGRVHASSRGIDLLDVILLTLFF